MGSPAPWPGWQRAGDSSAKQPTCPSPLKTGENPACVCVCSGRCWGRSQGAGTRSASARTCFPSCSPGAACSGCSPGDRARRLARPAGRHVPPAAAAGCVGLVRASDQTAVTLAGGSSPPPLAQPEPPPLVTAQLPETRLLGPSEPDGAVQKPWARLLMAGDGGCMSYAGCPRPCPRHCPHPCPRLAARRDARGAHSGSASPRPGLTLSPCCLHLRCSQNHRGREPPGQQPCDKASAAPCLRQSGSSSAR